MRTILGAIVGLVVCGCGSDDSAPAQCAQRVGSYRVHLVEEWGNCGPVADQVVTISHQPTTAELPSKGCTGTITYSDDNCAVTTDIECAVAGGKEASWGTVYWSRDGFVGSGQFGIKETNGSNFVVCSSMYKYDASKL